MEIPEDFKDIFYYTDLETAKLIISTSSLNFSHPSSFNDPFECDLSQVYFDPTVSDIDPLVARELSELKKEFGSALNGDILKRGYRTVTEEKISRAGIACFSLLSNHQLMWAHYADKYKGICLGFENDPRHIDVKDMSASGTVSYDKIETRINYCKNKRDAIKYIYLTKSKDWSYENEFRYVTLNGPGIYKFRNGFLKTITFGLRTSEMDIEFIMYYCKKHNIDVVFQRSIQNGLNIIYERITY